jgi:hypothetical protein
MALLPSGRVQVAQAAHSSSLSPLVAELTVGGRCLLALDLDQRFGAASRGARGPDLLGRSLVAGAIGAERCTPVATLVGLLPRLPSITPVAFRMVRPVFGSLIGSRPRGALPDEIAAYGARMRT